MDANDANQNMEILRAFLSQSRSSAANNNNVYFGLEQPALQPQQQQQQHPLEQHQQQVRPPAPPPQPAQFFLDTWQGLNNLAGAPSSLASRPPTAASSLTADNMCIPSRSNYSLATVSGFSLSAQPMDQQAQNSQGRRRDLTEQERFLIFVKILFKCLEKSDDPRLKPRAKAVVTECTRGNRMGDVNYMPLQDAVERRLRRHVGESYWTRAKLYYDQYMIRRGFGSTNTDSMEPVRISTFV